MSSSTPRTPEPAQAATERAGSTGIDRGHDGTDRANQRRVIAGLLSAFGVGFLIAAQSRINGELGVRLGDGMVAATISFGVGLVVLLIAYAAFPRVRRSAGRVRDAARRHGGDPPRLRPWHFLGGVCGAYLVATQSITVGLLGVAVFTVGVVGGQATSSLVVDRLGVGPAGPKPVTAPRVIGAVLALGAVVLSVSDQFGGDTHLLLVVLPALAGLGIAWQQAVNGRVSSAALDPSGLRGGGPSGAIVAALVNFAVGTTALVLATAVDLLLRGLPEPLPINPVLYLGGLCGVAFITLAAVIVPYTGVLLLGLGSVAGQLVGALLLDLVLPADTGHLTTVTVLGTALALIAVSVAALPTRRRAQRAG